MKRVMIIGMDGAEPFLVQRWMADGTLPHLKALADRGSFLLCGSTTPPATFPAWTTCVTGMNPGRHGIFDFTEMVEGRYALRFVNASFRRAPALWNIASEAGKRVCVLGVPGTYPPEPVNGIMVSGFDSPVCTAVDASFVYPAAAYPLVKEWRFADFQESDLDDGWHAMALERLLKGIETKQRIATSLLEREPWDFFMMVFGESDTVAHHFWLFHDTNSPRHRPGPADAIHHVYTRLDEAIGALIERAGPDVFVIVVSDHGFGGAGTGVVHLNNWLEQRGYLARVPAPESLLKQAALRFVPASWRGALFRRMTNLAASAEGRSRFAGINWAHTKAWSEELNYFPSIRINLEGRESQGHVKPAEYDAFCERLCADLESWDAVAHAWPRRALYDGPYLASAPDIILELALENGYSHSCLRSRGGPAFRRIRDDEYLGGKEKGMTGNHRPIGTLITSEPVYSGYASLEDIAPTVLADMGLPAPPMDGTSLVAGHRRAAAASAAAAVSPYSPEQERVIEARLRDLGYFE